MHHKALKRQLQQIAKRAGVSVGSVYHTFPTKQAILVAVLAPIFEGTMDTVANQFNDNTFGKGFESVEELVKVTIADRFYFADKNINVIRLMLGQMLVNSVFVEDLKIFRATGQTVSFTNNCSPPS